MELVEKYFKHQVRGFNKLVQSQSQRLTLEGVHDLRVSTRRLRSLLWLIKSTKAPIPANTKKALKDLGSALGEKRKWDVALKGARKYHLSQKSLLKKQKKAGQDLRKVLKKPQTLALKLNLTSLNRSFKNQNLKIPQKDLRTLKIEIKKWLQSKNLTRAEMHELRISAKKMRYVFEALNSPVKELEKLQDRLGKSHDLTMLNDYFHSPKTVKKDEKKEMKRAKKQIRPALRSSLDVVKSLR
jgi:CHAD domain-containing protein